MLPMPGLSGRLPKTEKKSLSFVISLLIFSEALGFSAKPVRKSGPACQLTFSEGRAFMLASTSAAGLIFLKPPNDYGFLPIERVKLNSKISSYIISFNTSLDRRSNIFYMTLKVPSQNKLDMLLMVE